MYTLKDAEPVIKYGILVSWLVERLENDEDIKCDELERLLSSLDILVEHKTKEIEGEK